MLHPTAAELARWVFTSRTCQLVAVTLAFWDYALTLEAEVRWMSSKKLSPVKALFLANRYLGLGVVFMNCMVFMSDTVSEKVNCDAYQHVQMIAAVVIILLVQAIMIYRLISIYEGSKRFTIAIQSLWLFEIVAIAAIIAYIGKAGLPTTVVSIAGVPGEARTSMCTPSHVPRFLAAFWIPVVTFELIALVLVLCKGLRHIRQFSDYGDWWCPVMIVGVLVRDSVLYFIINFAVYLGTALVWTLRPAGYVESPLALCIALTSTVGARLVLNLRDSCGSAPRVQTFVVPASGGIRDATWAVTSDDNLIAAQPRVFYESFEDRMRKRGRFPAIEMHSTLAAGSSRTLGVLDFGNGAV